MRAWLFAPFLSAFAPVTMAIEEPSYGVVQRLDGVELRPYAPYGVAQVLVAGPAEQAGSEAFPILAGYLFGTNWGERESDMAAPVTQAAVPVKLAMTAPVTQPRSGSWARPSGPSSAALARRKPQRWLVPSRGRARTRTVLRTVLAWRAGGRPRPPRPARLATPPAWSRAARSGAQRAHPTGEQRRGHFRQARQEVACGGKRSTAGSRLGRHRRVVTTSCSSCCPRASHGPRRPSRSIRGCNRAKCRAAGSR